MKNMIIAPCHWYSDNQDTQVIMRKNNHLKFTPKADQAQGKYDVTYCEDAEGKEIACSGSEAAHITITSSYTYQPDDFAMVYYVVLRGGVEELGVYPKDLNITIEASSMLTRKDGGTVAVNKFMNPVSKASLIVTSHQHQDHWMALSEVVGSTGAPTAAHELDAGPLPVTPGSTAGRRRHRGHRRAAVRCHPPSRPHARVGGARVERPGRR